MKAGSGRVGGQRMAGMGQAGGQRAAGGRRALRRRACRFDMTAKVLFIMSMKLMSPIV